MTNSTLRSLNVELPQRDVRYILHAVNELMIKLEVEIEKDPDGEEDITPMYAEDVLSLGDILNLPQFNGHPERGYHSPAGVFYEQEKIQDIFQRIQAGSDSPGG